MPKDSRRPSFTGDLKSRGTLMAVRQYECERARCFHHMKNFTSMRQGRWCDCVIVMQQRVLASSQQFAHKLGRSWEINTNDSSLCFFFFLGFLTEYTVHHVSLYRARTHAHCPIWNHTCISSVYVSLRSAATASSLPIGAVLLRLLHLLHAAVSYQCTRDMLSTIQQGLELIITLRYDKVRVQSKGPQYLLS